VFIKDFHLVNDEKAMIRNVVPSVVRLQFLDQSKNVSILNSLYFSVVKFDFRFLFGLSLENRELDKPGRGSRSAVGEMPNDMIQTGPQMMDNLSGENSETQRNNLIAVIISRFLESLVVRVGDDWVLPVLDKEIDLGLQIRDVLIGPL